MSKSEVWAYVAGLLDAWESGDRPPREVFNEARALWLSGRWPRSVERGYDAVGMELLFLLSQARDMGLDDLDIPALRAYVSERRLDRAQERFHSQWEAIGLGERERLGTREDYYGPPPADGVDDAEATFSDPEDRRLHRLVRTDPEAVWEDVRARLCAPPPRDELFLVDLVEDLMYNDPDAFIDRVEAVLAECQHARGPVEEAYVGGTASTPGLERFWALQERLGNPS